MSEYLFHNKNTKISQIIFSLRSKTFGIKVWRPCKYSNDLSVKYDKCQENMDHFVNVWNMEKKLKSVVKTYWKRTQRKNSYSSVH